jgi:hypothetical protein
MSSPKIKPHIKFALSESTLLKRKVNWDTNQKSKKGKPMTGEKPLYEQRVVHLLEFKRPSLIPTAKEENEKFSGQDGQESYTM